MLMTLTLMGCQSPSQSVNVFQLSHGPKASIVDFDATQLLIKRIELVDYLKQSNIVFEHKNGELIATKYQAWAEPIGKGIARTLINEINASQQAIRADSSMFSSCRDNNKCFSVQLFVEKFYPSFESNVKFSGKYKLYLGDAVIEQQDFNLEKRLNDDGYPHAVDSLKSLVGQLGNKITKRVSREP